MKSVEYSQLVKRKLLKLKKERSSGTDDVNRLQVILVVACSFCIEGIVLYPIKEKNGQIQDEVPIRGKRADAK